MCGTVYYEDDRRRRRLREIATPHTTVPRCLSTRNPCCHSSLHARQRAANTVREPRLPSACERSRRPAPLDPTLHSHAFRATHVPTRASVHASPLARAVSAAIPQPSPRIRPQRFFRAVTPMLPSALNALLTSAGSGVPLLPSLAFAVAPSTKLREDSWSICSTNRAFSSAAEGSMLGSARMRYRGALPPLSLRPLLPPPLAASAASSRMHASN